MKSLLLAQEVVDLTASCGNVVGVGVDLVQVSDIRESIATFGDRYLLRLFSSQEIADCHTTADPVPRLAARYVAKEATIKALRVEGAHPGWTSMVVRRHPAGWCDVMLLSGLAARLATGRGIDDLLVSLTHEGDMAMAVVVATRRMDAYTE